jgi:phosphoheptose isomerase
MSGRRTTRRGPGPRKRGPVRVLRQAQARAEAGPAGVADRDRVRAAFDEAITLHRQVAEREADGIEQAAAMMRAALQGGRQVLVFGNGGSAADAQHFAAELVGRFEVERRGWPVVALTADAAVVTSVANDFGFDEVFARQIDALGRKDDVAFAITTSGTSANVNRALRRARAAGMRTVALTGRTGGESAGLADVHVNVPGGTSARVQEVQRTILHVMCQLIERTD